MIPRTRTKLIPILAALALVPFLLYINRDGWGFDDDDDDGQRILEPWVPSQGRQLESTTPMAPRGKVAALTSWYTFNHDPQRKVQVSSESIAYINNLYTTATHFGVPLVVFHDALTEEFVAKYTNEYVSFQHAVPGTSMSTNDFSFFPYLEYVKEHDWIPSSLSTRPTFSSTLIRSATSKSTKALSRPIIHELRKFRCSTQFV